MTLLDLKRTTDTNVNLVLECPLVVMVVHMAILMDSVRGGARLNQSQVIRMKSAHMQNSIRKLLSVSVTSFSLSILSHWHRELQ
ncbi:hypothetical protein V3C99_015245 [Haemonchus contortus]